MPSPITLEALHILDAIERRGSFAAAAVELERAPSSLSYQIQKLEQDLDLIIFDRSGHKASFTDAGRLILNQGRQILAVTDNMVTEATLLANGWEPDLTIAFDGIITVDSFFPLVEAFSQVGKTRIKLQEEVLAGCWESLLQGRSDLLVCPKIKATPPEVKSEVIGKFSMVWVASASHYIHNRKGVFDEEAREKYRVIAIADTAREQAALSVNILQKQPRLTVTSFYAKVEALKAGLGIGTLPKQVAMPLVDSGDLKLIEGGEERSADIVVAWRRNTSGEAKSWCIQYLKNQWKI